MVRYFNIKEYIITIQENPTATQRNRQNINDALEGPEFVMNSNPNDFLKEIMEREDIIESFPISMTEGGTYNLEGWGKDIGRISLTYNGVEFLYFRSGHDKHVLYHQIANLFEDELLPHASYDYTIHDPQGNLIERRYDIFKYGCTVSEIVTKYPEFREIEA